MRSSISLNEEELKERYKLTHVEIKVLVQIAYGSKRKEAAEYLNISFHTIKTHLENAYRKLGVHSKIEALLKLIEISVSVFLIINTLTEM